MDVGYFEFLFQNCLALNMMSDAGCSQTSSRVARGWEMVWEKVLQGQGVKVTI